MLRRLIIIASILSSALVAVAWLVARQVLHPKRRVEDHGLDEFDLPAEEIAFASRDGTRLRGWFIPARDAGASPGVVLSHGWARSRAELLPHANFLHRAGFAVLAFDYRHRGESEGDAITMGLRERGDLLGALDELSARSEVDPERIGVLGISMGAVMALLVAGRDRRVRAVVAECPYSSSTAIMTRAMWHYYRLPSFPFGPLVKWQIGRQLGEPLEVPAAVDVVPDIAPRQLLLIADERDAVLGADETERLFAAAREPKQLWLIPDADHARGWQTTPEEYERRVLEFLQGALESAGVPSQYARSGGDGDGAGAGG